MPFSACRRPAGLPTRYRSKARRLRECLARIRRDSGRYQIIRRTETQYEPGSRRRVLGNLLGIRSAREMDRVEQRELIRTTKWALRHYRRDHRFTAQDLCDLHRRWLGGLYPWAGYYRQVNVSKGGFPFAAASLIPMLMNEFESDMLGRHTPMQSHHRVLRTVALAETHTEFLLIHPFREGNGRMARLLAILMCWQAGLRAPAFEDMLKRRTAEYFAAVRAGLDRNYDPMRALFSELVCGDEP